jgi:hypothetical protein
VYSRDSVLRFYRARSGNAAGTPWEAYQFLTLGEGKSEGTYYGTHFETEAEYGFTDQLQASLSVIQHYFYNKGGQWRPRCLGQHQRLSLPRI